MERVERKLQKKTTSAEATTHYEQGNDKVQEMAYYTMAKTLHHVQIK